MNFSVAPGSIEEAYRLTQDIPEFNNPVYEISEYQQRLGKDSLILIGYSEGSPIAFKAGYPRGQKGYFYSWLGGVLPEYRRQGIAKALAVEQEEWVKKKNFSHLWFKTRNRNRAMIHFAINNGFAITQVQPKGQVEDYRIILEKAL